MDPQDTQPQNNTDPNDLDNSPGSLRFVPRKAESMPEETVQTIQSPETPESKEKAAEKLPQTETEPKPAPQNQLPQQEPEQKQKEQSSPQKPTANIVDKSQQPLKLHHIEKPKDKLTEKADEEEEKFIKEVEAAHEQP